MIVPHLPYWFDCHNKIECLNHLLFLDIKIER
jgi:hypothetical protein